MLIKLTWFIVYIKVYEHLFSKEEFMYYLYKFAPNVYVRARVCVSVCTSMCARARENVLILLKSYTLYICPAKISCKHLSVSVYEG